MKSGYRNQGWGLVHGTDVDRRSLRAGGVRKGQSVGGRQLKMSSTNGLGLDSEGRGADVILEAGGGVVGGVAIHTRNGFGPACVSLFTFSTCITRSIFRLRILGYC